MPQRPYNKPATTYDQQAARLRSRGMIINDDAVAKFYLQHINYYRLTAYWLPFELNHTTHQFKPNTRFEDVMALYNFDRELRLLMLDAIERIEVSARAQWAYCLGHRYGSHAHLNSALALNAYHWQKNKADLKKEVDRADEIFIQHLVATYSEELPPIWASCEVMSLGLLSKWYKNLGPMAARKAISSVYELDENVFQSWLHHIAVVRNNCAHHSRVWNRDYSRLRTMHPHRNPAYLVGEFVGNHKLYNSIIMVLHLLDKISPQHHWRTKIRALLNANSSWLVDMGFPNNWQTRPIWQDRP